MSETKPHQRMNDLAIIFGAEIDRYGFAFFRKLPQVPLFVRWLEDRGETMIAELANESTRYWFHRQPERVGHTEQ